MCFCLTGINLKRVLFLCRSFQSWQGDIHQRWFRVTAGKRRIRKRRGRPRESGAGPGHSAGDKRKRQSASSGACSPEARKEEKGCSPDRSEDVLFCFSSALPLPAGSNITLSPKAGASLDRGSGPDVCWLHTDRDGPTGTWVEGRRKLMGDRKKASRC